MNKSIRKTLLFTLCVFMIIPLCSCKARVRDANVFYLPQLSIIGDTEGITVEHKTIIKTWPDSEVNETWVLKNNGTEDKTFEVAYPGLTDAYYSIDGSKQTDRYYYFCPANKINLDLLDGTYLEKLKNGEYLKDIDTTFEDLGLDKIIHPDDTVKAYEIDLYPEDEELYEILRQERPKVTINVKSNEEDSYVYYYINDADHDPEITIPYGVMDDGTIITAELDLFTEDTFQRTSNSSWIFVIGRDIGEESISVSAVKTRDGREYTGTVTRKELTFKEYVDLLADICCRERDIPDDVSVDKYYESIRSVIYKMFADYWFNGYDIVAVTDDSWVYNGDFVEGEFIVEQELTGEVIRGPVESLNEREWYISKDRIKDVGRVLKPLTISGRYAYAMTEVTVPAGGEVTLTLDGNFKLLYSSKESASRIIVTAAQETGVQYESYDFEIEIDKSKAKLFDDNMKLEKAGENVRCASLDPYQDGYELTYTVSEH